ncbi:MAG: hypothetical protein KC563_03865 [Nitrospira sp.]|nr:hypothetical protein [Nitrospira sp.]MCA9466106.1 hypothetical protein [Nitrospira sp.]MCA9474933.1 hypothetical protein [Nitrospira sp.]MCA9478851.1 hypothetical protein [Nitrospira sp.]MCB9710121.1 hypothetical protein [Nitrospiraceae bacterium]
MAEKKGLRLEARGEGSYYKAILHVGSTLIPISDDILEELRGQTGLNPEPFFKLFLDKVGYSSYLTEQIRQAVQEAGDLTPQIQAIQQFLKQPHE